MSLIENVLKKARFDEQRPRGTIIADSPEARAVVFAFQSGQEVGSHTSPSRVFLYCVRGKGAFLKGESWYPVREGDFLGFEPGEAHAMRAEEEMVVLALIAPCP